MCSRGLKNFTIVELLVCLAVLVILLSLLQPSLQNALTIAKGVSCQSNLKNIGVAMANYTYDHERYTPYYNRKFPGAKGNSVTWDDLLGRGYDGRNLSAAQANATYLPLRDSESHPYLCPLDHKDWREEDTGNSQMETQKANAQARTYSINSFSSSGGLNKAESDRLGITGVIFGNSTIPTQPWSVLASDLVVPAETIAITERPGIGFVGGGYNRHTVNIIWQDGTIMEGTFGLKPLSNKRYHNSGYNYLMADGHVENLIPEDTMGPSGTLGSPKGLWSRRPND